MALLSVRVEEFRCVELAELELDRRTTFITGPNGSGKTSLLECIYVLGRGRSFRTARLETAIRDGQETARVVGTVEDGARRVTIGVEARRGSTSARVAGEAARSLAELSTHLPVQAIDPGVHKLIEEGPSRRRRYLDWGVFHVERGYLLKWQRFHRALLQRNAALRQLASDEVLEAWDREFVAAGLEVAHARTGYFERVRPYLESAARALLDLDATFAYRPGWPASADLASTVASRRPLDRSRRATTVGPHRADLTIHTTGGEAKYNVSRGQQKLLAAALILGQLSFLQAEQDLVPTLLLDDPAAELDADRLARLLGEVGRLRAQLVVTALQPTAFDTLGDPGRAFHVERGRVTRML